MSNKRLVVDIETTGVPYESLDTFSREYIESYAATPNELEEAKNSLGFSPLTGEIVAIGMLNPDTDKGSIFLRTDDPVPAEILPGIALLTGTEEVILRKFWEVALHYQQFITFNGRCFDAPYLMIRSAILGVKPSKNLLANRYLSSQPSHSLHIDLLDQMSFYGAFRGRKSLHFWCRAFGLKSPKEDGVTGDDVAKLIAEKKFEDIARYNYGDLLATKGLFEKWNEYLNF